MALIPTSSYWKVFCISLSFFVVSKKKKLQKCKLIDNYLSEENIYKTILWKAIHIRHSFTVQQHVLPREICYGFIGCKKLDITATEIQNYMTCLLSRNFRIRKQLFAYVTENFSMKMQFQLKENSYWKNVSETLWNRFLFLFSSNISGRGWVE